MSPPDTVENDWRILLRLQKGSGRDPRFAVRAAGESETCAIDQREGLVVFVAFSRAFFSCTRVPLRVPYIASFPSWQAYS